MEELTCKQGTNWNKKQNEPLFITIFGYSAARALFQAQAGVITPRAVGEGCRINRTNLGLHSRLNGVRDSVAQPWDFNDRFIVVRSVTFSIRWVGSQLSNLLSLISDFFQVAKRFEERTPFFGSFLLKGDEIVHSSAQF